MNYLLSKLSYSQNSNPPVSKKSPSPVEPSQEEPEPDKLRTNPSTKGSDSTATETISSPPTAQSSLTSNTDALFITPVPATNTDTTTGTNRNNIALPTLNLSRSFNAQHSNNSSQSSYGRFNSMNQPASVGSMSLMNQNGNLHNKLSDYGDVLANLRNGDSSCNTDQPPMLTPLTTRPTLNFDTAQNRRPSLKPFDFKNAVSKKEKHPNPMPFSEFKPKSKPAHSFNSFVDRNLKDEILNDEKYKEILKNSGYLLINGQRISTCMDDLTSISELGSGTCGQVYKMVHNPTGYVMAVKQMGITGVAEENKRIIMDLDVVLKSHDCADIVRCLGYFISNSDVWICMELMSMCFDKLLKHIKQPIPEEILGKMSVSTINALHYLKQTHNVIHRDIKPSNILINESGQMKLCDFGISGNLINSNAKSRNNTGCAGYMAPERIDPPDHANPVYDIRADVWSLGLTLVELATGEYPYKKCKNEFEVMSTILSQEAPTKKLESSEFNFSRNFKSFVNKCLVKDVNKRPKYNILLQDPFILHYKDPDTEVDVEAWFKKAMASCSSRSNSRGELTPVSSLSNLTIDSVESESTSTTPTATSNSITSL